MKQWDRNAACAASGLPTDAWFPEHVDDTTRDALTVCESCPVRVECLTVALADTVTVGIWGGHRAVIRRRLRRTAQRQRWATRPWAREILTAARPDRWTTTTELCIAAGPTIPAALAENVTGVPRGARRPGTRAAGVVLIVVETARVLTTERRLVNDPDDPLQWRRVAWAAPEGG